MTKSNFKVKRIEDKFSKYNNTYCIEFNGHFRDYWDRLITDYNIINILIPYDGIKTQEGGIVFKTKEGTEKSYRNIKKI